MSEPLVLATRKSALALAQTAQVEAALGLASERLPLSTTGDQQQAWALESAEPRGLFTGELEQALADGRAHAAVHSAKDLPTQLAEGMVIAAYLPRAPAHDILLLRQGCAWPEVIATSSPRRRAQLKRRFPSAIWEDIRGNVETRLKKVASAKTDATLLAAAGLARLGLTAFEGISFCPLTLAQAVPAPGQGAIAVEAPEALAPRFAHLDCPATRAAVELERALLHASGGGCHSAIGIHVRGPHLHLFDEERGYRQLLLGHKQPPLADPEALRHWLSTLKPLTCLT